MTVVLPVSAEDDNSRDPGRVGVRIVCFLITVYRQAVSARRPPACRYVPSCSQFAETAIARFGVPAGSLLVARRIMRCHPWHAGGYDPVPPAVEIMSGPSLLSHVRSAARSRRRALERQHA